MTEAKRVHKVILLDVTAMIYWLKNRRPHQWRNRRNDNEDEDNEWVITFEGGAEDAAV